MPVPSETTADFIRKRAGKTTVTNVSSPTITVYRPEKPNGTSVIVAPGGGYAFLSAVHEGTQVCEWLNTLGVTGILLTYRTPTRDESAPHQKPVQDAQKALEIIRLHATEWKLKGDRIGFLGFSAGGNLLAHLACDRSPENYPQDYDQDAQKQRPDFGVMIYGGGFLDPADPMKLKPGFTVPPDAPPLFVACAGDDGTNPVAATLLYLEYKRQNLPAEIHLYSEGGHGFGMRENHQPINHWPARCAGWMDSRGWLPTMAKLDTSIRRKENELKSITQQLAAFGCADDLPLFMREIAKVEARLTSLKASQKTSNPQVIQQLETHLTKMRAAVDRMKLDMSKNTFDPAEFEAAKSALVKLQAERDWLQQIQSSPAAR
ncbi:alpha/beta hydrolase [Prosthecobacter fusiformis]|nr:alpha/beta hydrolase [Prosthecobacter fusiformis]